MRSSASAKCRTSFQEIGEHHAARTWTGDSRHNVACGFAARAEETEFDPAKVSESLKAIFQFGSVETKKALNANTVTLISGTIAAPMFSLRRPCLRAR